MGFLGAIAGVLGCVPIVLYFFNNPIDMTQFSKDAASIYEKFGLVPVFPMRLCLEGFLLVLGKVRCLASIKR